MEGRKLRGMEEGLDGVKDEELGTGEKGGIGGWRRDRGKDGGTDRGRELGKVQATFPYNKSWQDMTDCPSGEFLTDRHITVQYIAVNGYSPLLKAAIYSMHIF